MTMRHLHLELLSKNSVTSTVIAIQRPDGTFPCPAVFLDAFLKENGKKILYCKQLYIFRKMKKILAILCCVCALSATAAAQSKTKKNPKDEDNTQYRTVIDMIRKLPGVVVSAGTGDGGAMPDMYIRGIGTNSGATQPLFVVDGVITENIMYLEPKDVDSVEVLKDGTASIYGMRGANGVILINTKFAVEAQQRAAEAARAAKEAKRAARKAAKNK